MPQIQIQESLESPALATVLEQLDSGPAWAVAAAIVVRTEYHAERRLRMQYERGAYQVQETLEHLRDTSLPVVVDGILETYEKLLGDKTGDCLCVMIPSLMSPEKREELVSKIVDEIIEAAR
jgi:hypothetical protein